MRTVILADRAPGAFAQVRTPALPMGPLVPGVFESELFVCHVDVLSSVSTKATTMIIYSHCGEEFLVPGELCDTVASPLHRPHGLGLKDNLRIMDPWRTAIA